MIKTMKRTLGVVIGLMLMITLIPMFSANLVYAEELPDEDTAIAENYWGDLEKDNSIAGGIYPKNLMKPQESVLKNIKLSKAWDSPSTGVYKNANTLTYMLGADMFDYISKPELKDNEGDNGDPEYQDGKYHNPFHFSLDKDFIRDRDQLNVYGDISVNGNTEHDSVATHKVGDKLNVDFSVDLSNFGKFQNSRIWQNMNGHSAGMAWKHHGVDGVVSTDAEVVFSIKMPQGITVPDDVNVTIEGLSNFSIAKETVDGKLLIKLRKNQEDEGYMTAKNYYELINKIAEVKIHIEGIAVGENVPLNQPLAISGSVVGVHDEYITDNVDKAKNKSSDDSDYDARAFYFFVAKQSKAGRDAAAPQDKPNLISYTFKVKAPEQNTVTFINGDKEYAKVKVENGKSISGDALDKESMPKDPTKAGYVFKEWNTQSDGKGTAFTGETTVNENMIVYAIYDKKAEVLNAVPKIETKDATITKGDDFDLKSLVVKATDEEEGDLTKDVKIIDDGGFDKDKVGKYTITFEVKDSKGATGKATAKVTVKGKAAKPGRKDHYVNTGESTLNVDDHYAYMKGYPNKTFGPDKLMTRAEATMMFARLLKERPEKGREYIMPYKDIAENDWYAYAVTFMSEKKLVLGYPDGTFKPNAPITRAEFAAIASRFDSLADKADLKFTDVSKNHWAYKVIGSAEAKGWITGYPDGTFKPEKNITRAEVVSLTNRILNRYADLDFAKSHVQELAPMVDMYDSHWAYSPVVEAMNGHDYKRLSDGKSERWIGLNGKRFTFPLPPYGEEK